MPMRNRSIDHAFAYGEIHCGIFLFLLAASLLEIWATSQIDLKYSTNFIRFFDYL